MANIVNEIRKLGSQGYTQHEIAAELNAKKLKTPRGKNWSAMNVSRALARSKNGGGSMPSSKSQVDTIIDICAMDLKRNEKRKIIGALIGAQS